MILILFCNYLITDIGRLGNLLTGVYELGIEVRIYDLFLIGYLCRIDIEISEISKY